MRVVGSLATKYAPPWSIKMASDEVKKIPWDGLEHFCL